jgi:hypothetical protein
MPGQAASCPTQGEAGLRVLIEVSQGSVVSTSLREEWTEGPVINARGIGVRRIGTDLSRLVLLPRAVPLFRQFMVYPFDEVLLRRREAGGGVVERAASIEGQIPSLSTKLSLSSLERSFPKSRYRASRPLRRQVVVGSGAA